MNKKAYLLLLTIIILSIFSYISMNIIRNINLKEENKTKHILNIQAKNHLIFLQEYVLSLDINNIKTIKIEDEVFDIYAQVINEEAFLFVKYKHKNYSISSYKKLLLK